MSLRILGLVTVVLIAVVSLTIVSQQHSAVSFDRTSAWNAALKDAQDAYPQSDKAITPLAINQNNAGEWQIDAKISLQPHSACPKVFVRHYSLNPIHYREEERTTNCQVGGAIAFEEEAIIASNKDPRARDAAARGGQAFASYVEAEKFQSSTFSGFLTALQPPQNVWIVEWRVPDGNNVLVAVDANANVLKAQQA